MNQERKPTSQTATLSLYAVFHLNLAFSSIEESQRPRVIERCYWPLLHTLLRLGIPAGIELSAFTLETIAEIDPSWIKALQDWIERGGELIACGDTQLIGPLVPWELNLRNLELGQSAYQRLLGRRPELAFVNEQAYSAGVADSLLASGFSGAMMEWDNPRMLHPEWQFPPLQPILARTAGGQALPVLWNHTISFQKFQRLAHGELVVADYIEYLMLLRHKGARFLPVYGNDVEVFGFRPGRFRQEAPNGGELEWQRIGNLLAELGKVPDFRWVSPTKALEDALSGQASVTVSLESPAQPVPVKKQKKYNMSRWAVSGRDDLWLNTACWRLFCALRDNPHATDAQWKALCRAWSSDFRTHITEPRFKRALAGISRLAQELDISLPDSTRPRQALSEEGILSRSSTFDVRFDGERQRIEIQCASASLTFNVYRGMTIERLAFSDHPGAILGTLPHGHFENIELGADFYTAQAIGELYRQADRITDLEPARWNLAADREHLRLFARVKTRHGDLLKTYNLDVDGSLRMRFEFPGWSRPFGSFRVGYLTLLPHPAPAFLACHNGGKDLEAFVLDGDFDQGEPASTLVSAQSGLGATGGRLLYGYSSHAVDVRWNPADAAVMPLVTNRYRDGQYLRQVAFSLVEQDDTLREGGRLLDFECTLRPADEGLLRRVFKY